MKKFYDAVRPMFRHGQMTEAQVEGCAAIVNYGQQYGYQRSHIAAALGTAFHEVGQRMQPVREGFCVTDKASRLAVKRLYDRGIIYVDYAKPVNGQSYYGRGLVQMTWLDNYRKFAKLLSIDLVGNPDLALNLEVSVQILFVGMRDGMFRKGRSFNMLPENPTRKEWIASRDIINGDVRKNGAKIADYCQRFYQALSYVKVIEQPFIPDLVLPEPYNSEQEKSSIWKTLWKMLKWVLARFGG